MSEQSLSADRRILVTGANGFLGRHVVPVLEEKYGAGNVVAVSRKDYDLMSFDACRQALRDHRPTVVVHLAAFVGGIGANKSRPAEFYFTNSILTANMFQAAAELGVEKLLYTMGGCSYPATATSPIGEDQMWSGYPQPESAGYSAAKKMGIVASLSYRQQYGLNSVVLVPGNLYGEYDNFRNSESHVIPALLRRVLEAKLRGDETLGAWGSGKPVRDFVYAGDVARLFPYFIETYNSSDPVNLSSGTTTSIKELVESVKEMLNFPGPIVWDSTKPDGQMVKIFDVSKMKSLGLSCPTSLSDGMKRTAAWLEANYATAGDGLRL